MAHPYFTKTLLFFAFVIFGYGTLDAQEKEKPVPKTVPGRHYVFTARSYSSASSGTRQLAPDEYTVEIKDDSVTVSLPYYGASYSAQINQTDGGIKFTSTDFLYSFTEKKKGKCEITIKPKDVRGVQQLFLTVFSDGAALLQVTSTNREAVSLNGYLIVN